MKLRTQLALTVIALSTPIAPAVAWMRARFERDAVVRELASFALARMEDGERARCEADPRNFPRPAELLRVGGRPGRMPGGPRGGPPDDDRERLAREGPPPRFELFAYDASLRSPNPGVPPVPIDLEAALRAGTDRALSELELGSEWLHQVVLRSPWPEGPCAVLLVRRRSPRPLPGPFTYIGTSFVAAGAVLLGVLVAAGPLVRRIRRLTESVQRAAAERYRDPIAGGRRDELGDLARAFDRAGGELRSALLDLEQRERTLRTFVENTTHDVGIPLTVLQGHLSELAARAHDARDTAQVGAAIEEAQYIGALLRNLGTVARLETADFVPERRDVDMTELVRRVVARHRPLAHERGIAFEEVLPGEPLPFVGDVTLLEEAVGNLVHNALRYVERGGRVAVVLGRRQSDGALRLAVLDDGPGIPADRRERLLDRGARDPAARSRHPEGQGLGLAIVGEVAARHGLELTLGPSELGGLEAVLTPA